MFSTLVRVYPYPKLWLGCLVMRIPLLGPTRPGNQMALCQCGPWHHGGGGAAQFTVILDGILTHLCVSIHFYPFLGQSD